MSVHPFAIRIQDTSGVRIAALNQPVCRIGAAASCPIRASLPLPHALTTVLQGHVVQVINRLSTPITCGRLQLAPGHPQIWPIGATLQVGETKLTLINAQRSAVTDPALRTPDTATATAAAATIGKSSPQTTPVSAASAKSAAGNGLSNGMRLTIIGVCGALSTLLLVANAPPAEHHASAPVTACLQELEDALRRTPHHAPARSRLETLADLVARCRLQPSAGNGSLTPAERDAIEYCRSLAGSKAGRDPNSSVTPAERRLATRIADLLAEGA